MADVPETQYAMAADGTHIAYQVLGNGPLDLVFLPGVMIPIDLMWEDPAVVRMGKRLGAFTRTVFSETRGTERLKAT